MPSGPSTAVFDLSSKVSSLIDVETTCWNIETLKEMFDDNDVRHIHNIPLSFQLPEDKFIWNHKRDGEYSVRLVYHVQGELRNTNRPGLSS